MSLAALDALGLDEVWWLVSPGNPLKPRSGMAPFAARLASARAMARQSRIRVSDIEARMGTRFTVDTITRLTARHPRDRFVWLMGEDTVAQYHRWKDWRCCPARAMMAAPGRLARWAGFVASSGPVARQDIGRNGVHRRSFF